MIPSILPLKHPIDYLLETDKHVVACAYEFKDNKRSGGVYFLDKNTLQILSFKETSGTLQACYSNGILYTANAKDISSFSGFNLISKYETSDLNTCIAADDDLYVCDTSGNIRILDLRLNEKKLIKISENPIWTVKVEDRLLYVGDEAGSLFIYSLNDEKISRIDRESKKGIIEILFNRNTFLVSSYDEEVVLYSKETLHEMRRYKEIGALWKILRWGDYLISSSIYGGVKIFDQEFTPIKLIETETICYGICISGNNIIWAPYYSNRIEWMSLESLSNRLC